MNAIKKMLLIITTIVVFFPTIITGAVQRDYLANVRDRIVFPELTTEEKRTVVEQAQIFLRDLYVHRFQKMDYYGKQFDVVPAIERVVNNLDNMSTAEMEEALYRIFVSQRDLHLNYYFPAPYRNYINFIPISFKRTASRSNYFEVRVSAVNEELYKQFYPDQPVPAVGDRVVFYDNLPILKAIRRQMKTAQGANLFGGFSRSLQRMTYVHCRYHLAPEKNEVRIGFISSNDEGNHSDDYESNLSRTFSYNDKTHENVKNVYFASLPWIAQWTEPDRQIKKPETFKQKRKLPVYDNLGVDEEQEDYNNFMEDVDLMKRGEALPNNPTNVEVLKWGIIKNNHGTFGYLLLKTFNPSEGIDFAIGEMRRIILDKFQQTDGLIFDVRNNGGGIITFADKLSQFFGKNDAKVLTFRMLNNELNYRFFNESEYGKNGKPEWKKVINDAHGTGKVFTRGARFTWESEANAYGQIYFKPVAVITNARCYSSTDMFSCSMQDNKTALIYGEDPLTGAGGANVVTHDFFRYYMPDYFPALPNDHAMRVSWRQTLRFGKNEGKLIEDYGCNADRDISLTREDLLNGGMVQIEKVTRSLAKRAKYYTANPHPTELLHELYFNNENSTYGFNVVNTPYVHVYLNNDYYTTIYSYPSNSERFVEVKLPTTLELAKRHLMTFEGVNYWNRKLWNFKRSVSFIEKKIILDEQDFDLDFSSASSIEQLTIINGSNDAADGWVSVPPALQVGYSPKYKNNIDTDALLNLDFSHVATAQLALTLEFDTENDYDFINVIATTGTREILLFKASGQQAAQTINVDLKEVIGKDNVALHFRFISDSYTTAQGVKLYNLSIKR